MILLPADLRLQKSCQETPTKVTVRRSAFTKVRDQLDLIIIIIKIIENKTIAPNILTENLGVKIG